MKPTRFWPIGTFVNMTTVTIGSLCGLLLQNILPQSIEAIVFQAIGLATLVIGMRMCLELDGKYLLGFIFSLLIGGIIGQGVGIDGYLAGFSTAIQETLSIDSSRFTEGLITAFILFCVGSMTIVGAIEEGIEGKRDLLYAKSLLDGVSSIAFTATYGIGVLFSIIPMLIFQGGLTVVAAYASSLFSPHVIHMVTAVGGAMIIGIAINLLNIGRINVENLLPALLVAAIVAWAQQRFEARRQLRRQNDEPG